MTLITITKAYSKILPCNKQNLIVVAELRSNHVNIMTYRFQQFPLFLPTVEQRQLYLPVSSS